MNRLVTLICFLAVAFAAFSQHALTSADLELLDKELQKVPIYDQIKYARLDSLKKEYRSKKISLPQKFKSALKIGKEYDAFIADSALRYYEDAVRLAQINHDSIGAIEARIGRMKVLSVTGFFKEASSELDDIESHPIPDQLKILFFNNARQLYVFMMAYTEQNTVYYKKYQKLNEHYRSELLKLVPQNSSIYKYYEAESLRESGDITDSKIILTNLISSLSQLDPLYPRATNNLASISTMEGQPTLGASYLVQSAISDIKGSIKENTSLQNLAIYLYSTGDIEHAYKYIRISMEDANFCNARLRNLQISKNMPLIDSAYKAQIDKQKQKLWIYLIVVSVLSVCLLITMALGYYQMKKLRTARMKLKVANSTKEEYMGHFLDLCSIYMERLDNFCKVVTRKVSTGQLEDLMKMTRSPKFADEQNKTFYENFDSAFLHIYPTFVEEFNALLIPEERIIIKDYGKLSMELRIFAFLRMGVDDSTKIASFLHYSVNTIYTYRNRIKNKAINRETFDEDIMKLGSPE